MTQGVPKSVGTRVRVMQYEADVVSYLRNVTYRGHRAPKSEWRHMYPGGRTGIRQFFKFDADDGETESDEECTSALKAPVVKTVRILHLTTSEVRQQCSQGQTMSRNASEMQRERIFDELWPAGECSPVLERMDTI